MTWLELPPHSDTAYEATLEHTGITLYIHKSANGWHYRINLGEQVRYISPVYSEPDEAQHHAMQKVRRLLEQDLNALPTFTLAEQAYWFIKRTGQPVTRKVVAENIPEIDYLELTLTNYPHVRFEIGEVQGEQGAFVTVHDDNEPEQILLNNHCIYGDVEVLVAAIVGYLQLELIGSSKPANPWLIQEKAGQDAQN